MSTSGAADAGVMVFLDYQNVHLIAHRRFHPPGAPMALTHVDPLRVAELLVARRHEPSELAGVRVYRGEPSPTRQPRPATAHRRQSQRWRGSGPVTVVSRPLRYPPSWPGSPPQEKGIDVALAIDFVRLALERTYDVGIIFSSDTDLLPALETVASLKLARVEVAAWSKAFRLRFPASSRPWCHHLTADDYAAVADPTDYARGPGATGR